MLDEVAADRVDQLARCFNHNLVPTGNEMIDDPPIRTGLQVYQELFQSAVGIAGAAGNFDGNGRYVRASAGGGAIRVADPRRSPRPARSTATRCCRRSAPARRSRARRRRSAATSPATRTRRRTSTTYDRSRAVKRAIVIHRQDFIAIVALVVAAIAVAATCSVTSRRSRSGRATTPSRREFATGAAVTAGQGQSVDVAGVQVGQVGGVQLQDGRALVTMNIFKKYQPIYHNATVLLRPRTPLKDMYLSLDPGTKSAGAIPNGGTLGIANTQPGRQRRADPLLAGRRHAQLPAAAARRRRAGVPRPRREGRGPEPGRRRRSARHVQALCAAQPRHADVHEAARGRARRTSAARSTTCSW